MTCRQAVNSSARPVAVVMACPDLRVRCSLIGRGTVDPSDFFFEAEKTRGIAAPYIRERSAAKRTSPFEALS